MSRSPLLSRRRAAQLLAALLADRANVVSAQSVPGPASPPPRPKPEGRPRDINIGGTGVVGTIRRFGSIVVNDLRIAYPDDIEVSIDGEPAPASALQLGHVVRVAAARNGDGLAATSIEVFSEVVGPVEAAAEEQLTVLGQVVSLTKAPDGDWKPGDRVAVSGLRLPNGQIVASLVEHRPPGPLHVAGLLTMGANGHPAIGALQIEGVDPSLVGQRLFLVGVPAKGKFRATAVLPESALLRRLGADLSVEAYVAESKTGLQIGSGLAVDQDRVAGLDAEPRLTVLSLSVESSGRLALAGVREEHPAVEPTPPASHNQSKASSSKHGGHGKK